MSNTELLKQRCIELAISTNGIPPDQIVSQADTYFGFISGRSSITAETAPQTSSNDDADAKLAAQYNQLVAPEYAPVVTTVPEYDASGLPWDERIHASTKTKTAKNLWTRRRGVDDALVDAVESELRGAIAPAPLPDPATLFAPQQSAATLPDPSTLFAQQPVTAPIVNFASLTQRITNGFANGKIDASYLTTVCVRISYKFGVIVNTITDIMNNQEMVEYADYLIASDSLGF